MKWRSKSNYRELEKLSQDEVADKKQLQRVGEIKLR